MDDTTRVWISSRRCRKRKTYHLRWIDPAQGKMRSKRAGTDRKHAEREAARLEDQLSQGTYREARKIPWAAFVDDHVSKIEGRRDAVEARRTLDEFGSFANPASPRSVTYSMIEAFVVHVVTKGNKPATVNKKLRYIRAAMNRAIKRGYAGQNPMDPELFKAVDQKPPRVLTGEEETLLLESAETLRGYRMRAFLYTALNTGGRRAELLGLTWDRVRLDGDEPQVHFSRTKSHRDRIVPINPGLVGVLRRVQAQTMRVGGPFAGMDDNLGREWGQVREAVDLVDVTIHDLRRTYITRLIRAGVPLPTVQELAGHADIKTTLKYYNWVSGTDKREAVKLLQQHGAG